MTPTFEAQVFNMFSRLSHRGVRSGSSSRKVDCLIGACICIVARKENLPLTILDVSEVIDTTIWKLGRTFMKITRDLGETIPSPDPVLLVFRCTSRLSDLLGEQMNLVSVDASRLVRVIKKSSLDIGRRPFPIAAAAIKYSCEANGLSVDFRDLSFATKSGKYSIEKRYKELQRILLNLGSKPKFLFRNNNN